MTDDSIALREPLEKSADADLPRDMITFAPERRMELGVQSLAGTGYGERSPDRPARRNGDRDRGWRPRRDRQAANPSALAVFTLLSLHDSAACPR